MPEEATSHPPAAPVTPGIAFLGYLASRERVLADESLSLADNRMQHGYVQALRGEYDDVAVFSSVPASPGQGAGVRDVVDDGVPVRHLGTPTTRVRRVVGKPLTLVRELDRWARGHRDREQPTILVYYNTFFLYGLVAAWLRRRHGTRIVPIAITLPYSAPDATQSRAGLLQDRLSRRLLRSVDGLIAITPFLAQALAPGVPTLVVHGAVQDEALTVANPADPDEPAHRPGPFRVVYAGNLSHRYHLDAAVAMMAHLPAGDFVLDVYGRGAVEPMLREAADASPSVRFHGAVTESAVAPLLRDADVLLALLSPDDDLARHSFPSKLFESLASGTPVVTTDLPTLDEEMRRHLTVVDNLDPSTLARAVTDLSSRAPARRREAAASAHAFLQASGTWSAVGRRIKHFFNSLEAPPHG